MKIKTIRIVFLILLLMTFFIGCSGDFEEESNLSESIDEVSSINEMDSEDSSSNASKILLPEKDVCIHEKLKEFDYSEFDYDVYNWSIVENLTEDEINIFLKQASLLSEHLIMSFTDNHSTGTILSSEDIENFDIYKFIISAWFYNKHEIHPYNDYGKIDNTGYAVVPECNAQEIANQFFSIENWQYKKQDEDIYCSKQQSYVFQTGIGGFYRNIILKNINSKYIKNNHTIVTDLDIFSGTAWEYDGPSELLNRITVTFELQSIQENIFLTHSEVTYK